MNIHFFGYNNIIFSPFTYIGDGEMAFDEFVRLLSNESDAHEEVSATREAFEVFDTVNPNNFITVSIDIPLSCKV